jgi:hypothetical protein
MTPEDDEGLDKATLTVTFTAYPYMVSDTPKVYDAELPASGQTTVSVINESAHPVPLTVTNTTGITLKVGDALTAALSPGGGTYGTIRLPVGLTTVTLTNSEARKGSIRISFCEEVF